jgi:hypothetical protein
MRTGRAIRIPASGEITEINECPLEFPHLNEVALGSRESLVEIVRPRFINGDMRLSETGVNLVLLVDEEGLIKRLTPNMRATILYIPSPSYRGWIAGDALLLAEDFVKVEDETGSYYAPDLVGLPDDVTLSSLKGVLADLSEVALQSAFRRR